MSVPIYDARDTVYRSGVTANSQPRRPDYAWPAVSQDAGSGGFPWFRGRTPSPYNPNGPTQATDQPPEDQGPPDQRQNGIFGNMSPKDLMSLLAALTSTVGALRSNSGSSQVSSATTDPAMQEVLNLMAGRLRKSEPMFDSVQAMTNGLLPTAYQRGNFTPFTPGGGSAPGGGTGGGTGGGLTDAEVEANTRY